MENKSQPQPLQSAEEVYVPVSVEDENKQKQPYGYGLEFSFHECNGRWVKHWNHKIYQTVECLENAVKEMRSVYATNYLFRAVPLYAGESKLLNNPNHSPKTDIQ